VTGEAEVPVADACSAPYRVRFDEAGPDGLLRTSVALRYAQDLAWYHSAERGFDRAWYAERGLAWLVRAAEVAIVGEARVGDGLVGTTRVLGWRRVWARRQTDLVDATGSTVASARIDWVLLDGRGSPVRIPTDFGVFGAGEATFPLGRVALDEPPPGADRARFTVRPQELDPMDHVNNAAYADWLEERVLAAGRDAGRRAVRAIPRTVRLEYARAAEPGAEMAAVTWADGDGRGWSCRIVDSDDRDVLRARLEPGRVGD
jgi:acyl-CoA thioesterase FadM